MEAMGRKKSFVWNKSQLNNVNVDETDHLWGKSFVLIISPVNVCLFS